MKSSSKKIKFWDVAPRILADFCVVHMAMLLAFAVSIAYQRQGESAAAHAEMERAFRHYYISWFILISPLFPVIFYLNGIYTHVRYYPDWTKLKRFVLSVLLSSVVFISVNFFLFPSKSPVGRIVAFLFVPLVVLGLVGTRIAKEYLIDRERAEQNRKARAIEQGPVLVIGGAGYIGCWFVSRLLEEGYRVRVLDNAVYGLDPIQGLLKHPNLDYQDGDCRNIQDVVKAMRRVSSVVHLAAIVGDPACEVDRNTAIETNYAATRMLVEVAKGNGVERFLFASSCSVYGATDELMDENSPIQPVSLYGETKEASERALLAAAGDGFHPVLMRFATVFGLSNRPRFDLVVNLLTAKACQDGVITIYNGQQWRPFVHVKDLAEAMLLVLDAPLGSISRQVLNVGDNRLNHTLADVAHVIQHVIPAARVEWIENADRRNYRVKFDKIEQRLGFRCRYSLEDGVREIKAALDSNQIDSYLNVRFSNLSFLRESGVPGNKNHIDGQIMAAFAGERMPHVVQEDNRGLYAKAKSAGTN